MKEIENFYDNWSIKGEMRRQAIAIRVTHAIIEHWQLRVSLAALAFENGYSLHSLRAVNADLATDLRALSATFDQSLVTGTNEESGRHGKALCWKWLTARRAMEQRADHVARISFNQHSSTPSATSVAA